MSQFIDKVYDAYLNQDYECGKDNLNPVREISKYQRVDKQKGGLDAELQAILRKIANDTTTIGSKYDNINLNDAKNILNSDKNTADDVNQFNIGGGIGSESLLGADLNPLSDNGNASLGPSARALIARGGGNPNTDALFDTGPIDLSELDSIIRRQIEKVIAVIKNIENITGQNLPNGGKIKFKSGGSVLPPGGDSILPGIIYDIDGSPLPPGGRPPSGDNDGTDDTGWPFGGKVPIGDITDDELDFFGGGPSENEEETPDIDTDDGEDEDEGDSSAPALSMLDIDCKGVFNLETGEVADLNKKGFSGDESDADDDEDDYLGADKADKEGLEPLIKCAQKDLEWLQMFLIVLQVIQTIKKILDPALNITMQIVQIVVLAAGCWVNPTGAGEIIQLIISQIITILLQLTGKLIAWIWKLLGLDCVTAQSIEIIEKIMAAIADMEKAFGEVNSMALKLNSTAKAVAMGTGALVESMQSIVTNIGDSWNTFTDSMPSGEDIGKMFLDELKGNGLKTLDESSDGTISQVYQAYNTAKSSVNTLKKDWDKLSKAFTSKSKANNAIGAIGSMFTGSFWSSAFEDGKETAQGKSSDMAGAIDKAGSLASNFRK